MPKRDRGSTAEEPKTLFEEEDDDDLSSDDDQKDTVRINKKYAADFESRKSKEELRKVRFESNDVEDDSSTGSSSSSEDEDAVQLTTKLDVDIIKTIHAVRNKDSTIYDSSVRFFDNKDDNDDEKKVSRKQKRKPMKYKDVVREHVLEEMENRDAGDAHVMDSKPSKLAYDEEQMDVRKAFLESTNDYDDDSDDEVLLQKKTHARRGSDDDADILKQEIEKLKGGSNNNIVDPKGEVEDGEGFLLEFFKNRSWKEKEEMYSHHDDSDSAEENELNGHDSDASLQDLDQADAFESQYNFRFEEGETGTGADHSLQTYARGQTVNTLRRKDDARSLARAARKERKLLERKQKEEQLKRLKNAKRNEMEDKLTQIKTVLGGMEKDTLDEAAIMKLLEGDFEPDKFETLMEKTYNEEFYQQKDTEWTNDQAVRDSLKEDDEESNILGHDDEDGGLYDNVKEIEGNKSEEEDWEEDYDAEESQTEETEIEKKLKSKVEDELYKLDYEDIVAGIPTRFKYKQVKANSYGLSTEEILFAPDTTLKQFVSLKKLAPYSEQEHFVGAKRRRRFREQLKHELEGQVGKESDQTEANEDEEAHIETTKKKKRRRLKKGTKQKDITIEAKDTISSSDPDNATGMDSTAAQDGKLPGRVDCSNETMTKGAKSRRRRKKKHVVEDADDQASSKAGVSESVVERTQEREKKSKKKKKKSTQVEGVSNSRLASYGL